MAESDLTLEQLKELFTYDPEVGHFVRNVGRSGRRAHAGAVAGAPNKKGHLYINIGSKKYAAHRLAWFYVCGNWPSGVIDHINGNKVDNRIANLRDVDSCINQQNRRSANKSNTLGVLGVCKDKNSYVAAISIDGISKRLGSFKTADDAHRAYLEAKRALHDGCTI